MIHMHELARPCLTRRRGEEVYSRLQSGSYADPIEVDLNGVDLLSMSFLDGLIAKLLSANEASRITFVTDDEAVLHKLARIAEIRDAKLYYREDRSPIRHITPVAVQSP